MHKIFVPQLAVADFEVQNVADALRQLESISTKDSGSFSFYYKKDAHTGTFYKLFSRSGGRLVFAEKEYIYRPLERSSTPRIRLVLAVPSDRVHVTTQHEFKRLVRSVQFTALIAQSIYASALRQRYNVNEKCNCHNCVTFSFDIEWNQKTAEVPMERRSYGGTDRIMLSEPSHEYSCMDSELPSLAVLTTDRTSAELFGLKNKAAYFIECLELLGERDPQQLLNLIFILPQQSENPRSVTWQSEECFETKRDVSVITSPVLKLLPDCVVAINKILWCTNQLEVRYCRSLPRVVSYKEVDANSFAVALRHTRGGAVASLLGAIVHEIGHLLKLPHTEHGIMKTGGDNIQTLFLSDKLLNLAISESNSAHPDVAVEFFVGDREVIVSKALISKRIRQAHFDDVALDLLNCLKFLEWHSRNDNAIIRAILFERVQRLVISDADIVRVVHFSADRQANLISVHKYCSTRRLFLPKTIQNGRILVINSDGNAAVFAV